MGYLISQRIRKSIFGIVVIAVLFSPLFVFAAPFDFNLSGPLVPCQGASSSPCNFNALVALVGNIIDWLLAFGAFIAAFMFAYAGILYITAAGNETQIARATSIFKNVFWGFIFALGAWLVVELITSTLLREELSPLEALYLLSTGIV